MFPLVYKASRPMARELQLFWYTDDPESWGDSMDYLESLLHERSDELLLLLQGDAGLTNRQARDLLDVAGPALVESWKWWTDRHGPSRPNTSPAARELLALMPGNSLAHAAGLDRAAPWEGLRTVVPAVLEFGAPRRRRSRRRAVAFP